MAIDGPAPGESSASSGAPFESVMTPAQSLQWQMGFQAGDPSCMAYPNGVTTSSECVLHPFVSILRADIMSIVAGDLANYKLPLLPPLLLYLLNFTSTLVLV